MKLNLAIPRERREFDKFAEKVAELNRSHVEHKVQELHGSLGETVLGTARARWQLPDTSEVELREHIECCHAHGLRFNYMANAPSMGNREYDPSYRSKALSFLDRLIDYGVDSFTIANPFIIDLIKREYPDVEVCASVVCGVDNVNKALFYEKMGVDRVTLSLDINRRFDLIERIKGNVKCDLEVLTNQLCLLDCPYFHYHHTMFGYASLIDHEVEQRCDYPALLCNIKKLREPVEIIKSPWIRPEDLRVYEECGVNYGKIVSRDMPANWLLERAEAYMQGKYEGNLYKIVMSADAEILKKRYDLGDLDIKIENRLLDGLLDFFISDCRKECESCDYCDSVAERVLYLDEDDRQRYTKKMEEIVDAYLG